MEQGRFEQSQPPSAEQGSEGLDDPKIKKKKQRVGWLKAEAPGAENKKETLTKEAEAVWQRLIGERPAVGTEAAEVPKAAEESAEPSAAEAGAADTEATLEALDAEEERYALDAYVGAREAALQADTTEDEPPEETAARTANLAFLAAVRRHLALAGSEARIEAPVDQAYLEAAAELDEEPAEGGHDNTDAAPARGGRGGSSGVPPVSPHGRSSASFGPDGPGSLPTADLYPSALNVAPTSVPESETVYIRKPSASNLLVGGIVGYLIGRRRGRIKTEKRLGVVQKELEQRVEAVQALVADREAKIRQLAREKTAARRTAVAAGRSEATTHAGRHTAEYTPKRSAPARAEVSPAAMRQPERASRKTELTNREIIDMSEKIVIGATNLRQVYEAKLIGESGLRRLVYEHLEGGDIRRGLAREFLVKEMSFERDPRLRDSLVGLEGLKTRRPPVAPTPDVTPAHASSRPAPVPPTDGTTELPRHIKVQQKSGQQSVNPVLLIGLTLLTIGLAIYAVLLSLNR